MKILENMINFFFKKEVYGSILIIVIALILYNLGKLAISKTIKTSKNTYDIKKRKTVVSIFESVFKYILFLVTLICLLELYGINTRNLIAGLGIAGVVVGLGLQDTMKDIISGLSIIMENYFVVGDFININGFVGQVIEFGLKSTKIKNGSGEVLVISNRTIEKVINISQKKAYLVINIPTAYEEKTVKVEKVLTNMLEKIKDFKYVMDDCSYLGISELGSSEVLYTIKIECNQEHQWEVKRQVLKLIKDTYDKEKIKIPYNQIEVHNGDNI